MPNASATSHPNEQTAAPTDATRRTFIALGVGALGACYAGLIGYPVYQYLATPARKAAAIGAVTQTVLDGADKLPAGSVLMFKFGPNPAMLIHHTDGTWVAFGAVCTHLACTVSYEPEQARIYCACHGGVYDPKTGANVAGPPPKPLTRYKVEVQDGRILVSKV
ncbi:MAG: Rieske (2Fe-2S) protein [Chloracidobacterium sp.]|nr:Rieske (2Fe-2S) protein [Chloracidobacterium sp.]MDW8216002.1 Rieske (2Fe-2S) protein [Acidobacteriota bacterium]